MENKRGASRLISKAGLSIALAYTETIKLFLAPSFLEAFDLESNL
jgi:hypothetical protein